MPKIKPYSTAHMDMVRFAELEDSAFLKDDKIALHINTLSSVLQELRDAGVRKRIFGKKPADDISAWQSRCQAITNKQDLLELARDIETVLPAEVRQLKILVLYDLRHPFHKHLHNVLQAANILRKRVVSIAGMERKVNPAPAAREATLPAAAATKAVAPVSLTPVLGKLPDVIFNVDKFCDVYKTTSAFRNVRFNHDALDKIAKAQEGATALETLTAAVPHLMQIASVIGPVAEGRESDLPLGMDHPRARIFAQAASDSLKEIRQHLQRYVDAAPESPRLFQDWLTVAKQRDALRAADMPTTPVVRDSRLLLNHQFPKFITFPPNTFPLIPRHH